MKRLRIVALGLLLTGCAAAPPPRLILLTNDLAAPPAAVGAARPLLAVRSVQLPEYLLRAAVVYRSASAELARFPDAVWAERLNVAVTRWIAQQLAADLPQYEVRAYGGTTTPAAALEVTLYRFEALAPQTFQLRGDWRLVPLSVATAPAGGTLAVDVPLSAVTPEAVVVAMNAALEQATRSIAEHLRALPPGAPLTGS
jgi:uncharacterized lipoprotein YmbA